MTADQALAAIVETIDALREAEFQRAMTEGGHVPVAPLAPLTEMEIASAFHPNLLDGFATAEVEYIQNYGKDAATVRAVVIARALGVDK